jgi:hypothetical protein
VSNIYFVNVKGDEKYDCIFPTIVGKRRLRLGKSLLPNIYFVNVKAIFPTIVGKRGLRLRENFSKARFRQFLLGKINRLVGENTIFTKENGFLGDLKLPLASRYHSVGFAIAAFPF